MKIAPNCYVITGGAIKLTDDMAPKHLQDELAKLERVRHFLQDLDITFPSDLSSPA